MLPFLGTTLMVLWGSCHLSRFPGLCLVSFAGTSSLHSLVVFRAQRPFWGFLASLASSGILQIFSGVFYFLLLRRGPLCNI